MNSLRSAFTAVPKTKRRKEEVEATNQAPPRQQPLYVALSGGQHTAHVRCLLHPGLHCHLTEPMPVWVTWLNDLTGSRIESPLNKWHRSQYVFWVTSTLNTPRRSAQYVGTCRCPEEILMPSRETLRLREENRTATKT